MSGEKLTVLLYKPFKKLTPWPPLFSREGGTSRLATSYPLSIRQPNVCFTHVGDPTIERGTRGELRKAMKICQLWTFSLGF
jgi:hypothetical protein